MFKQCYLNLVMSEINKNNLNRHLINNCKSSITEEKELSNGAIVNNISDSNNINITNITKTSYYKKNKTPENIKYKSIKNNLANKSKNLSKEPEKTTKTDLRSKKQSTASLKNKP